MEQEGLAGQDAVVTATGLDELNMIVSLYADSVGVPQVITKLGQGGDRNIIDALKLGSTVCPKDLVVNNIVRYVRAMQNQVGAAISVHTIADGQVEAMEFVVDSNTRNCGVALKDLKLRDNVLIASITHGFRTEIPNGDSRYQVGDSVVIVTTDRGTVWQLNDIFA
jgi:trk system potassium uptake protein TrkA